MNVTVECTDLQFADRLRNVIRGMADASGVSTAVPVLVVQVQLNEAERTVVVRKGGSAVTLHTGLPISRHLDSTLIDAVGPSALPDG